MQKPRVTEIQVRMDCNGCVQKIKKALHGINGIYDLYIDFPQQKLTIIGWADPEKIVKAIRKTRKIATICSHTEPTQEPPPPTDQPAPQEGNNTNPNEPPPPQVAANPPPSEPSPPPEQAPPAEPPKDQPPPDNPPPEPQPSPGAAGQPAASGPKDVGGVHVIYHNPPDYGYRYSYGHHGYNAYWNKYHNSQGHPQEGPVHVSPVPVHVSPVPPPPQPQLQPQPPQPQQQPQPVYVTQSYNMHTPSPYVTEYEYVRSPPRPQAHYYPRMERMYNNYDYDQNQYYYYNNGSTSSNGNITSIFSDENPNACRIV
ncbi:hypothetical protein L484_001695 [Morus notabilis]|uniref:HMA domain-containing protein n=1 Tax=Morus notabilis TaxID=981085 RepID=W9SDU4_9ROSA|nr:hypothetical protein L484_001695 [Morus notabilis]